MTLNSDPYYLIQTPNNEIKTTMTHVKYSIA